MIMGVVQGNVLNLIIKRQLYANNTKRNSKLSFHV